MSNGFNSDQINKLNGLGIEIGMGTVDQRQNINFSKKNNSIWYLVPVVGLGLAGFGIALAVANKNNNVSEYVDIKQTDGSAVARISPTGTGSSVQQYLLSSQQYFSQAMQIQSSGGSNREIVEFLNKSIAEASQAINDFGDDFRVWQQRGKIYQSLISQNEQLSQQDAVFLKQAIADLSKSHNLNSDSAEVSRNLASLYARTGDSQKTTYYLSEAIRIEPTKAQNFYDLAKIQSQIGQLDGALETYKQLIWLVSDKDQRDMLEKEKTALEKILAQNPDLATKQKKSLLPSPTESLNREGPVIKASKDSGVVIAAYEDRQDISVEGMTESNSMSGTTRLEAGQKDVEVKNDQLDDSSQVYVSSIRGGKNQVLRVKSKTDSSFRVGLDIPSSEDIEFKWWIVK